MKPFRPAVISMMTLSSLLLFSPADATSEPPPILLSLMMEEAAASDSAGPAPNEEKQRVPKTPSDERGRTGDQGKAKEEENDDDDDDDNDEVGCFFDCIFSVFSAIGNSSDDHATAAPSVSVPPEVLWAAGTLAIVMPSDSSGYGALIWADPSDEEAGAEPVTDLPEGSDVVVHDSRVLADGLWLHVSVAGAQEPMGWMRAEDLVPRRPELSSTPPSSVAKTERRRWPFGVAGDFSWFDTGPEDVSEEYEGGGWRVGLHGVRQFGGAGRVVLSAGYSWAKGEPKFNYVTPTQIDYPQSSLLQIVDLGLSAGLDLRLSTRSDLRLDIGPTLCWVRESAEMDYDTLQGGVVVGSGHREESLEEWRVGGQLNMDLGTRLGSAFRIGLLLRAFVISWNGESQESLTLDYIGTQPLVGGGIGIRLGF